MITPFHQSEQTRKQDTGRQGNKREVSLCNLVLKVTSHIFNHILLLIISKLLGPVNTQYRRCHRA